MIRRREFVAGLGGAVAWPLSALALQLEVPGVGLLTDEAIGDRHRIDHDDLSCNPRLGNIDASPVQGNY